MLEKLGVLLLSVMILTACGAESESKPSPTRIPITSQNDSIVNHKRGGAIEFAYLARLGLSLLIPMAEDEITRSAHGGVVLTVGNNITRPVALFIPDKLGSGSVEFIDRRSNRRTVNILVSSVQISPLNVESQRVADESLDIRTEIIMLVGHQKRTLNFNSPNSKIIPSDPSKVAVERLNNSLILTGRTPGITDLTILNGNDSVKVRYYIMVVQ